MSYDFDPMTDEELEKSGLLENGIYNFEVSKAERKPSQSSGNPMAKLSLKVWGNDGSIHYVYDYLVFSKIPLCIKKIKHFCDAVGLSEEYKKGQIPEELENYSGKVELKIEEGQLIPDDKLNGKPKGSTYPTKNVVVDYVMTDKGAVKAPLADDMLNDDIPF